MSKEIKQESTARRDARLTPQTDIRPEAVEDLVEALTALLADVFALYIKTKNFPWHMSGSHFRYYHLLLDEHGDQDFAMTDRHRRKSTEDWRNHGALRRPYRQSQTDRR